MDMAPSAVHHLIGIHPKVSCVSPLLALSIARESSEEQNSSCNALQQTRRIIFPCQDSLIAALSLWCSDGPLSVIALFCVLGLIFDLRKTGGWVFNYTTSGGGWYLELVWHRFQCSLFNDVSRHQPKREKSAFRLLWLVESFIHQRFYTNA